MPSLVRLSFLAATAGTTLAAAAPPDGWTATPTDGQGIQVYRSSRGGHRAEFRIHPAEASPQGLADWFESRRLSAPAGYRGSFQPAKRSSPMLVLANGEGVDDEGRKVYVVRMGCQRPRGGLVFAEALLSADPDYLKAIVPELARLYEPACFAGEAGPVASPAAARRRGGEDAAYAHVAPRGQGLKAGDVEAVLREWRNEQSGMTMQVRTYYYLLLKDGSYRNGLPPVALDDFDAAAARRTEGGKWGRWTRAGGHYHLVRAGSNHVNKVEASTGRQPAKRDERLEGTWQIDTAHSTAWSVARSRRAIQFGRDGRFTRDSGGSIVGGVGSADAGNAVSGGVAYDDDGSSATIGSAVAGGGSSRRRPSTLPDRSGSYRLDGYTLELTYDSGRVERLPFVATADRDQLYFNGEELSRVKPGRR